MLHARFSLVALSLFILAFSCTKDDLPNAGDKLLYRVVSDNDSLISATFYYDAKNRLTKVVDSIRYGHQWETSIVYNRSGNPEKLTTLYRSPYKIVDFAVIDSLVYEDGKVARKYQDWPYSPHAGHFILTHHYVYDIKGNLIKHFGGQTPDLTTESWHTRFSYDGDGNFIKMEQSNYYAGMISTTISYTSELNPYHNTGLMLYFVKGDNLLLGKHNKARAVRQVPNQVPLTIDYDYQYDRDGLLKKMVISRSQAGTSDSSSTFDFYYQ